MLKPYSIRKEFLLTLIVGGVCALLHYIMVQQELWSSQSILKKVSMFLQ